MLSYNFLWKPELVWAAVTAVALVVAQAVQATDPSVVADWRTWSLAVVGAAVRAGLGAFLDAARTPTSTEGL